MFIYFVMFDFSMAEVSLTLVAALLLIGPEELPAVIRSFRKVAAKSKQVLGEFTSSIMEIEEVSNLKNDVAKLNDDIKKIVDLDGNLQETYDMTDIMPEIEKAKQQMAGEKPKIEEKYTQENLENESQLDTAIKP